MTRWDRSSSLSDSPTMRPARSDASEPTSDRSDAAAAERSDSTWLSPAATMRPASCWACSRASATMAAACSRACSRIRFASPRASASWALYCSSAAFASACASSAWWIPPSMAAVRSAYVFSNTGTTNFATSSTRMPKNTSAMMNSDGAGTMGL